nr:AAA family ATPase [uncultured Dongia sp.]
MADADHTPGDERLQYARAALGWLLVAATHPDPWPQVWLSPARRASTLGGLLTERMISEHVTYVLASKEKKADTFGADLLAMRGKLPESFDLEDIPSRDSVVVLTQVGNHDIGEGKKVLREFGDLVSQPLPLVTTPDLSAVARTLNTELPHAVHITSAILSELVGRTHVRLPPLLFVGPPGAGKSYYAARLLEMLNVTAVAFPCGGVADAAFAGTSRRWASGTPAFPLSLIRQHKTASPGLILDELERASTNTHNGSLFDALRGMLEPETAGTWVDAYLEAPVNLSRVIWIATTNSVGQIPRPLRDRFRVFRFPPPTADDLPILALHLLQRLVADLGWDARWASPLDQEELNAVARVWPGGSMRVLRRYVQGIWRARLRSLIQQ